MGDSAIDQDDDPEDREHCRHGVSWNDPCDRCELDEEDAKTSEMLDELEDEDEDF